MAIFLFLYYSYIHNYLYHANIYSSGCNPVNCLSQTRRNLTIEYLNLNFVTTPKLIPLHSFFFFFLRLTHSRFASTYTSKPFRCRCFAAYPFEFKVFNQIGTRWYFQLVEKKKCFSWEIWKSFCTLIPQTKDSAMKPRIQSLNPYFSC